MPQAKQWLTDSLIKGFVDLEVGKSITGEWWFAFTLKDCKLGEWWTVQGLEIMSGTCQIEEKNKKIVDIIKIFTRFLFMANDIVYHAINLTNLVVILLEKTLNLYHFNRWKFYSISIANNH